MRMTSEQLDRLGAAEEATVMVCYHGVALKHECPEDRDEMPMFTIRFVGHLINGPDELGQDETGDVVDDHRVFSVDFPLPGPIMTDLAEKMAEWGMQATICGGPVGEFIKGMMDEFGSGIAVPMDQLPDKLKRILGLGDDDEDERRNPWM